MPSDGYSPTTVVLGPFEDGPAPLLPAIDDDNGTVPSPERQSISSSEEEVSFLLGVLYSVAFPGSWHPASDCLNFPLLIGLLCSFPGQPTRGP